MLKTDFKAHLFLLVKKKFIKKKTIIVLLFFFWPRHAACGSLNPRRGMESGPLAVKAPSLNHWTTKEFPLCCIWKMSLYLPLSSFNKYDQCLDMVSTSSSHFNESGVVVNARNTFKDSNFLMF